MRTRAFTTWALLEEAIAGLWRARRMTSLSIALITVSIFLVGAFLLAAENLRGVIETVRDETAITVFLKPGATNEDKLALEKTAEESRLVETIRRVSREEAERRFAASWRNLSQAATTLPSSPFPESIELDLKADAVHSEAVPQFLKNLANEKAAEEVQFDVEWIRRLRGAVTLTETGGILLGVFLALGAVFTIANVVRLTILLHRDEIEILRLVGAPEVLIRGPFLLGGLAQGLLGGGAAVGLLFVTFRALLRYVASTQNALLSVFVVRFLTPGVSLGLVAGGLVAGLVGGAFAVRKNLEG